MNQEIQEFGWWIEILTNNPKYIYYFGAFNSYYEAQFHKNGYIKDLEEEGSKIVNIQIKECQPKELTIRVKTRKVDAKGNKRKFYRESPKNAII